MKSYDPLRAPDPREWQSVDEAQRISLVKAYHRRTRAKLPDAQAHATIHVIVENQIAMGDEIPVRATLERLMREGLDRHNAVHAIGCVLTNHLQHVLHQPRERENPEYPYFVELKSFTAAKWYKDFG